MSEVVVERWESDDNREEIHLFMPGEANTYVMGWNPAMISEDTIRHILAQIGLSLPEGVDNPNDG